MSDIAISQITELQDPKLQKIAERIALEAELALEKVAASFAQPDEYPLVSDAKSIERILESHFNALPQTVKQRAAAAAINRIQAPAAERTARYGDLASVDLTNPLGIDMQAQGLPFPEELKLPPDHPIMIFNLRRQEGGQSVRLRQQTINRLELRIHRVKCMEETAGGGDDEIYLGGTNVDESGDAEMIGPFLVRDDFDDGEEQVYGPPRLFTSFDLTEGTDFPKSYFVTLVLAEVDNGGLPDFLHKLLMWVKEKVTTALTTAIGGAIGASGGPVGAAIGAAVGAAVGLIIDFVREIWEDDVFAPATVRADISSLDARWGDVTDSPDRVITYRGHGGEYQVTYDWRIVGPPVPEEMEVPQGILYAIEPAEMDIRTGRRTGGRLLWYRHDGRGDGSFTWAPGSGNQVGRGWGGFKQVFSGGDGVIYALHDNGDLLWYRHDGQDIGSFAWAASSGRQVGNGWGGFKQVFSGGDGVIYSIEPSEIDIRTGRRRGGRLLWYRHAGRNDGSFTWAPGSGNQVGRGWEGFKEVFSGGDGVLYAIEPSEIDIRTGRRTGGRLLWYRHDGRGDGSFAWAPGSGNQVGRGWGDFKQVFFGGDGVIYALQDNGDLLWYRHDGRSDGSFTWAASSGAKVGSGWNFRHVFCG